MDRRTMVAGAALALALLVGSGGGAAPVAASSCDTPSGFGQHTSQMARDHGGMAKATAHHNEMMMGTQFTVGEHMRMMHSMCGEMPAM